MTADQSANWKRQAAEAAAREVRSGMIVGLGSGSTAVFAVRRIAELLRSGALRDITGIATSRRVAEEAVAGAIPLLPDDASAVVDLTIDGADEVDPQWNLIKGGGGALLREKIVAQMSRRLLIVVDESKFSPALGTRFDLPVEVAPFAWRGQADYLRELGATPVLRMDGPESYRTDNGNCILDCRFGPISDPAALAARLAARAGVVEHGLFLDMVTEVFTAGPYGVRRLNRDV